MGFLINLLVLIVGAALAVRLGLIDMLRGQLGEALVATGAETPAMDLAGLLTISGLYAAMADLPPPFAAVGKLALTLVLIGLALVVTATLVSTLLRMMRWLRDLFV
jgi:hypothetical protein